MLNTNLISAIKSEYQLNWHGIHGVSHWARVRDIGLRLADKTGANTQVIELFAFLHDSRRFNDDHDPDHGSRAAVLAENLRGSVIHLANEEFELLTYACKHHTFGLMEADITVLTCWDADRLDLGRVGIMPSPYKLCTPAARDSSMIAWAYERSIR